MKKENGNYMVKRKKKPKMVFMRFLKNNKHFLKLFKKKIDNSKKYEREPWMMKPNPPIDDGEENLRKESESF